MHKAITRIYFNLADLLTRLLFGLKTRYCLIEIWLKTDFVSFFTLHSFSAAMMQQTQQSPPMDMFSLLPSSSLCHCSSSDGTQAFLPTPQPLGPFFGQSHSTSTISIPIPRGRGHTHNHAHNDDNDNDNSSSISSEGESLEKPNKTLSSPVVL
jgi:hypothetical protein